MQSDEGIKLVTEAICSGIFNDLGSGSNVDVCVITKVFYLPPVSYHCQQSLFVMLMQTSICCLRGIRSI